jgi:hypothetical protein
MDRPNAQSGIASSHDHVHCLGGRYLRGPGRVPGATDGVRAYVYDKPTRNIRAVLEGDRELRRWTPHGGAFSWPLLVGKEWHVGCRIDFWDKQRSFEPVENTWKVEDFETVAVPAGAFKAFHLQSTPGRNEASKFTLWWAPAVQLIVREQEERLPKHFLGPAMFTRELVEYRPPGHTVRSQAGGSAPVPGKASGKSQPKDAPATPLPSASTSAPTPPRVAAGPMHKVTYRVKGTAENATLTYRNAPGDLVQTEIKIPKDGAWSLAFDAGRDRFLSVSAQNVSTTGSISCEILLDGVVKAQVTGTGAYISVSCNHSTDR